MSSHLNPELEGLLEQFRLDRTYVRGQGAWLEDEQGRQILDLSSQYGAVPFGHNATAMWNALERVRREGTPALIQPSRPVNALKLAARLAALAPVTRQAGEPVVTFMQSGAEAVEVALRLARLATGRPLVVGAERGYHGKTLGASALTWTTAGKLPCETRPPGFAHFPWNDAPALERFFLAHPGEVAAVILEPIQGEAGVFEPAEDFLPRVRELCNRFGAKLILDEVQTGLGRTGRLFAAEHWGARADLIVLSKALGGGLVPLAATIAARDSWSEEFGLMHGSTFANNNLTCAVGLAVLEQLERNDHTILKQTTATGDFLKSGLAKIGQRFPGVFREVRGRGLLLAVELLPVGPESSFFFRHLCETESFGAVVACWLLHEQQVRVIPTHNHGLRIQPSLNLTLAEARRALAAFEALARTIALRDWSALVAPLATGTVSEREPEDCRALERPVQSSPVTRVEVGREPTKFAFLIHHTCPEDLLGTTAAFERLAPESRRALYDWTSRQPGHTNLCFMPEIRSATGARAQGWLMGLTHTPESMRARPRAEVSAEIGRAVVAAQELGAEVVGLGAFTSILTANGSEVANGVSALTTGSALTVATAVDGIELAAERIGLDLAHRRGLVLGLGVVGSAAAVVAADFLPQLTLVGNPERPERERLKARALMDRIYARALGRLEDERGRGVAAELRSALPSWRALGERGRRLVARLKDVARGDDEGVGLAVEIDWACASFFRQPPLELASHLAAVIGDADVVLAATSAAVPLVGPSDLKPGAIVCDVAKPADVARAVIEQRPDVLVFDGGLVRYPAPIAFGQNLGHEPGTNLACLTETIVLALEGVREGRFGVGLAGDLGERVPWIREAAKRHGFSVGELRSQGQVLGEERFARVREAARRLAPATRIAHSALRLPA